MKKVLWVLLGSVSSEYEGSVRCCWGSVSSECEGSVGAVEAV